QRVEHIGAHLQVNPFRDAEVLPQAEIQVPRTGYPDRAVAQRAGTHGGTRRLTYRDQLEGRWVQVLERAPPIRQNGRDSRRVDAAPIADRRTLSYVGGPARPSR